MPVWRLWTLAGLLSRNAGLVSEVAVWESVKSSLEGHVAGSDWRDRWKIQQLAQNFMAALGSFARRGRCWPALRREMRALAKSWAHRVDDGALLLFGLIVTFDGEFTEGIVLDVQSFDCLMGSDTDTRR